MFWGFCTLTHKAKVIAHQEHLEEELRFFIKMVIVTGKSQGLSEGNAKRKSDREEEMEIKGLAVILFLSSLVGYFIPAPKIGQMMHRVKESLVWVFQRCIIFPGPVGNIYWPDWVQCHCALQGASKLFWGRRKNWHWQNMAGERDVRSCFPRQGLFQSSLWGERMIRESFEIRL